MSKKEKIIIIILFLISIIVTITGLILTFIEVDLKEPTNKEFTKLMENIGCTINTEYDKAYDYIDSYLITNPNSCPYLISYIKFNDNKEKEKIFDSFVDELLNTQNITSKYRTSFLNHTEYTITTNDEFKATTIENNTTIYLSTKAKNKDEAQKILRDLGVRYKPDFKYLSITFLGIMIFLLALIASPLTTPFKTKNK